MSEDKIFAADSDLWVWSAKPQWRLSIGPHFSVDQFRAPNRFHRFMQRLFFGFKWERSH